MHYGYRSRRGLTGRNRYRDRSKRTLPSCTTHKLLMMSFHSPHSLNAIEHTWLLSCRLRMSYIPWKFRKVRIDCPARRQTVQRRIHLWRGIDIYGRSSGNTVRSVAKWLRPAADKQCTRHWEKGGRVPCLALPP